MNRNRNAIRSFLFLLLVPVGLTTSIEAQNGATGPATALRLTLPTATELALAHNHKLQLARLQVQASEEEKRIAESHALPTLANSSAVHHITELEGVVLPAGAFSSGTSAGLVPAQTLRIDQGASTSYTSGTSLDQPLTQLFRIHAGVKAAAAELNRTRIQANDAENRIALAVRELYFEILIAQKRQAALEDAIAAAKSTDQDTQDGVRQGRLLPDAALASQAAVLEQQQQSLETRLHLNALTLQLNDLLGLPIGRQLWLDPDALGTAPELPDRATAQREVIERSPAVQAARQQVEKARAGLTAATDEYIPNVTGVAHYSYQSGLPFLVHNFGIFGASVTYTLFDGGAREADVREARVKLAMAETERNQAQDDAQVEIAAAYDKVDQITQMVAVTEAALKARQESLRIKMERGKQDAELDSSVADAQAAVSKAEAALLSAKLNLLLAQSDAERILGERP